MRKKILIVEDDPFLAMDMEDALTYAGFDVLGPVAQVERGLEIIERDKPDAVTVDFDLGDEDSSAIVDKLEKESVPYIIVTGQIGRVLNSNSIDPAPFMTKPFDPRELVKSLEVMVEHL